MRDLFGYGASVHARISPGSRKDEALTDMNAAITSEQRE
jgi:hypothetical protein